MRNELLDNGTADLPGDEVGVAVPWEWPNAFDGLPAYVPIWSVWRIAPIRLRFR